jgi:Niemann-Pick C1 protein
MHLFDVSSIPESKTNSLKSRTFSDKWTGAVTAARVPIIKALHTITGFSAQNPKTTIVMVILLSFGLTGIGLYTNFSVEVDEHVIWTPKDSKPVQHMNWIENEAGFPKEPRYVDLFFHQDGGNVLGEEVRDRIRQLFQALDAVRELPGYDRVCATSSGCAVHGVVAFWNESLAIFEDQVLSDADAVTAMSAEYYPGGTPVAESSILGKSVRDDSNLLVSAESITVRIDLPDTDDAEDFETDTLEVIFDLGDLWKADATTSLRVEVLAERSFSDEFTRAIVKDIPLVPFVFIIMSIFTCVIFMKRHKVYSRSLLGFGAVVSVLFSIMSGYGLMFV